MRLSLAKMLVKAPPYALLIMSAVMLCRTSTAQQTTRAGESDEPSAAALEFFEKQVRPLLVSRCYECHGPDVKEPKGDLRLDTRSAILTGGDAGPAVVAGDPSKSLLIDAVNYGGLYQMPPKSKLPAAEIAVLTRWVQLGAPWPKTDRAASDPAKEEFDLEQRRAEHWAWQPVRPQHPPAVDNSDWPRGLIDRFILAKLQERGLVPAPPADRQTLIRRVYFALIGMPPTAGQVEAFVADPSPDAFERVVDRLLGSPRFGERWARHWLDLVRYAETRGHEFDFNSPNAYQYRDYVIRAFNADVPYDAFVSEHIAGDLMDDPRRNPVEGYHESILGTGFWFLGEWVHSPVDTRKDETDRFDNMIDVMSKTFLGLTVGCARCHDHKFDAITQDDYYALAGFLQSSSYRQVRFDAIEQNGRIAQELATLHGRTRRKIAHAFVRLRKDRLSRLTAYLMAAHQTILSTPSPTADDDASGLRHRLEKLAAEHCLEADLLDRWVTYLRDVQGDADDPLYLWATIAGAPNAADADGFAAIVKPTFDDWKARQADLDRARSRMKTIVDYATSGVQDWMHDGYAFGLAPVRPGHVVLGDDPQRPIQRVLRYGAARRDPLWSGLRPTPGTQRDDSRMGKWNRSGRTIRTPTFTIEADRVYYLVTGAGNAYAVVDSHRLNKGPLHAGLVNGWDDDGAGMPRWVAHDLTMNKGHRAHIEFTAKGEAGMAVLMVVAADQPPGEVHQGPDRLLLAAFGRASVSSPKSLAEAYERLLVDVADKLAAGQIGASSDPAGYAALADWIVRNADLFGRPEDGPSKDSAETLALYQTGRDRLVSDIQRRSRTAMAMWDGSSEDEYLLVRGSHMRVATLTPRRFLEAIAGSDQPPLTGGSGRMELANRMIEPSNPFVSRVMVNRIWHHLMGRGIVASVDNFGVLGEPPTHPELLDCLADRFVEDGWSVKRLIRAVVLSRTYRMSAVPSDAGWRVDPENRLWHRMAVRRLEGEAIRDAVLVISGRIDGKMSGPSTAVHLTPFMQGRGRPKDNGPIDGGGRRSIYLEVRRNFLSPMMLVFDTPIPFNTMGRRNRSNVPAQALIMMNDPFIVEQARVWARRVLATRELTARQRITGMYRSALARPPTGQELSDGLVFLDAQGRELGLPAEERLKDARVWADLCHVLMNVKEFIFIH